jgi:hypothetical protein
MKRLVAILTTATLLCASCAQKPEEERQKGQFDYPTAREIYDDCKWQVENYEEHRFLRSRCSTLMNGIYAGAFTSLYILGQETREMPYEVNTSTGNVLENEYNTKAKSHNNNLKNDPYLQRFNKVFSCENGLPLDLMLEKYIKRLAPEGIKRKPLEYYIAALWLKTIEKQCEGSIDTNIPNACTNNIMSMTDKGSIFISVSKSICTK